MKVLIKTLVFIFVIGCDCKKLCQMQTQTQTSNYDVGFDTNAAYVPTQNYYYENNNFDVGVRDYSYDYYPRGRYFDSGYGSVYDPYRSYDYTYYDSGYRPYTTTYGYTYSNSYNRHYSVRHQDRPRNQGCPPPIRHREENSCPPGYYRPRGR